MGENDKCKNCNKKIFGSVVKAREDNDSKICFYFCSERCLALYNNKNPNNKLIKIASVIGGYWH